MTDLLSRAIEYSKSKGVDLILEPLLGAGTDGTVWQSGERTAIKAFERLKNYEDELECYRRFQAEKIATFQGFAVPELEGYCDRLLVVEMSIVQPPYLLDFGKVYLDSPPPYHKDKMLLNNWYAECRELFGENWPRVQQLLFGLQKLGI